MPKKWSAYLARDTHMRVLLYKEIEKGQTFIICDSIHVCKKVPVFIVDLKCKSFAFKIKMPLLIYPALNWR